MTIFLIDIILKIGDYMCSVYENMSMMYFLKVLILILTISLPVILVSSGLVDILKNMISKKRNTKKIMIKLIMALIILIIPLSINQLSLKFDIFKCWNYSNLDNLASIISDENSTSLVYVPVVVEPMYIKNPYNIDIKLLKEKVENIIEDRDISVSFYNPLSNQEFDIKGDTKYVAASISKIHAVLNLYDWAFENNVDLKNITMNYRTSDYQSGSGILQGIDKSKAFTLYELSEYTIRYSDNIAWNMIRRYMQNKRSNTDYYKNLVGSDFVIENGTYIITANWAREIMKKIYYNENNNPYYEKLIEDLKNTTSHSKIDLYLDYDMVAHKTGSLYLNGYLYENDAAIIYSDNEYILTVMSKTKLSSDEICEIIGKISSVVYEEILK